MDEVPAVPRRTSEQIFLPCRSSKLYVVYRRHYGSERVNDFRYRYSRFCKTWT